MISKIRPATTWHLYRNMLFYPSGYQISNLLASQNAIFTFNGPPKLMKPIYEWVPQSITIPWYHCHAITSKWNEARTIKNCQNTFFTNNSLETSQQCIQVYLTSSKSLAEVCIQEHPLPSPLRAI